MKRIFCNTRLFHSLLFYGFIIGLSLFAIHTVGITETKAQTFTEETCTCTTCNMTVSKPVGQSCELYCQTLCVYATEVCDCCCEDGLHLLMPTGMGFSCANACLSEYCEGHGSVVECPPDCSITISPEEEIFSVDGGTGIISVNTGTTCDWSVESVPDWIDYVEPSAGTGAGEIYYEVLPTTEYRTATLLIGGTSFTITQTIGIPLLPESNAVIVEQIDFRDAPDSSIGEFTVYNSEANSATGFSSGYINVISQEGWVIRNLPILDSATFDAPSITTRFDLGVADGQDVTSISLYVEYSTEPVSDFTAGEFSSFPVTQVSYAAGGVDTDLTGYFLPPDLSSLIFEGELISIFYQTGHPNVQAAMNQCAPAAIGNSLQWLEDTQNLPIPHDHNKGLRGDDTLVGKLDEAMNRTVPDPTDRTRGSGVWPLDGKLKYISENNLKDKLVIKHQGNGYTGGTDNVALDGTTNLTRHEVTSYGKGSQVTHEWILNELKNGEDVEIDLAYLDAAGNVKGRHYVDVTGAGYILGIPYITHVSDHVQSDEDPNDNKGTDKVDFEWMIGDLALNSYARVDQAISESVADETPARSISGTIAGLGSDIPWWIACWKIDSDDWHTAEGYGSTSFALEELSAGQYMFGIYASDYPFGYYVSPNTLGYDWTQAGIVDLTNDNANLGTLTFSGGSLLSGTVTNSGIPVSDAWIGVYNTTTGFADGGWTDSEGMYQIPNLPDGTYKITTYGSYGSYNASLTISGSDLTHNITLGGSETGNLSGTITGGNSGESAVVKLFDSNGKFVQAVLTNTDGGTYEFPNLTPGDYVLKIDRKMDEMYEAILDVTIQAGEDVTYDVIL